MADTYTLISSVTVGAGGASSIDFTSIPATYTDLLVKLSGRTDTSGSANTFLRFNNDSASNYKWRNLYGFSGSVYSENDGAASPENTYIRFGYVDGSTLTTSTFGSAEAYIPNYTGSSYKSVSMDGVNETNGTNVGEQLAAGLWNSTSAINRITMTLPSGNFVQYSTAYLYGIKNS